MNKLKAVLSWIIISSQDPEKISLTLKGFVPFLVILLSWSHFEPALIQNISNQDIDLAVSSLVKLGEAISALVGLFGLLRKIYNSFGA